MSEYDQMRRSEELDDDGVLPEELEEEAETPFGKRALLCLLRRYQTDAERRLVINM